MIHYHGTPITPRSELCKMAGRSFCVSYANKNDADWCLANGQSVMWDNGAFSFHRIGKPVDWKRFHEWVEPRLSPIHWAVVPDVIDGSEVENMELIKQWPHRKDAAAVVWHLGESFWQLLKLCDLGFGKICFGSSGQYWQVGSELWERRVDHAFNELSKRGNLPHIHMLRGLAMAGSRWPFSSADSVNVGRNFKDIPVCPDAMARRIDAIQCPISWKIRPTQKDMFE